MIKISVLGCVAGLLLLAVPLYVMFKYRLRIMDVVLASVVRMVITLAVAGGLMYACISAGSVWVNVVAALLMTLAGAVLAVKRSRLSMRKLMLPMTAGMGAATIVVTAYMLLLVIDTQNPMAASILLPVVGMMVGAMMTSNAKALHAYFVGLKNHRQLYDYLVGNGATHRQAVGYFVRRSLEANMVPHARYMAYTVLSVSPALVWIMAMSGQGILEAALFSLVMAIAAMSASVLSLVVALVVARRYCFDDYMTMKEVK